MSDALEERRLSRMASLEARVAAIESTLTELISVIAEVEAALRGPRDTRTLAERMTGIGAPTPVTDAPAGQVYVAEQMTMQERYTGVRPK